MKTIAPWKLLEERTGHGPMGFMKLLGRRYELPNGHIVNWDIHTGATSIDVLALTPDNKVILSRQFRPGPNLVLDELPGGFIDKNEELLEAAARELLEETGYKGELELVGSVWLSSMSTIRSSVAIARNCVKAAEQHQDDGEDIVVVLKDIEDFIAQVRRGDLTGTDRAYRALDHAGLLHATAFA